MDGFFMDIGTTLEKCMNNYRVLHGGQLYVFFPATTMEYVYRTLKSSSHAVHHNVTKRY